MQIRTWEAEWTRSTMELQHKASPFMALMVSYFPYSDIGAQIFPVRPNYKLVPELKPRMWWCPTERLHMCQLGLVRGKGTTRQWAYKQLMEALCKS